MEFQLRGTSQRRRRTDVINPSRRCAATVIYRTRDVTAAAAAAAAVTDSDYRRDARITSALPVRGADGGKFSVQLCRVPDGVSDDDADDDRSGTERWSTRSLSEAASARRRAGRVGLGAVSTSWLRRRRLERAVDTDRRKHCIVLYSCHSV